MTTADGPAFSLVIPCYNEERGLPELVRRCAFVAREGDGEVILIDNGSVDNTALVLRDLLGPASTPGGRGIVRWVSVPVNRGYGFGIRAGLKEAMAPIIGWTHADLQTDPADALRALDCFRSDQPTLVKGLRFGRRFADRFFTAGMSVFESLLLFAPLNDINAQPTMFTRSLLDEWASPPDDFSLDLYAFYIARRSGFAIRRFPVIFAPRRWGSSSWNTDFRAKGRFIRRTIDFSVRLRRNL